MAFVEARGVRGEERRSREGRRAQGGGLMMEEMWKVGTKKEE